MAVTTYDVRDVNVIVNGRVITGFSDGSSIEAEKNQDNFTPHVGVKGEVTFAESNDETGTVTITVKSTSPSYPYLTSLANRRGESAIVPIQIVDLNTNSVQVGGNEARVMQPASAEWGNEESDREFSIYVADYKVR